MGRPEHTLVASVYDAVMAVPERTVLREHREYLTEGLSGHVLDIGAGTGGLFPYFEGLDVSVTAVEPDPHMRARALERASVVDAEIEVVDALGEELPLPEKSVDAVTASFVFCTIGNHERALSEVARVLGDGGEFRFLEHVRGDGLAGITHDTLAPCWHAVAGGCNLNRRQDELFLRDDRFRTAAFERLDSPAANLVPVVRGRLRRRRPRFERARRLLG